MRLLLCILSAAAALAQSPQPPARPEDAIAAKIRGAREDPKQTVSLVVQLLKEYPESQLADSGGYYFANAFRKQAALDPNPEALRVLAAQFTKAAAGAPEQLRVRMNTTAATAMLDFGLNREALDLVRLTIPLLDEKAYLAFARKGYDRDMAYLAYARQIPGYKPRAFVPSEWPERFHAQEAAYYSLLGRAYANLNQTGEAEKAYRKTYSIEPTAAAAVGLAAILSARGEDGEALEFLTRAQLSGRLNRAGVARFHELFAKLHGGKLDGVEAYLDDRFRETYRNPIRAADYQGVAERVALAEFFTGAGCVPCIPYDYSFEKTLQVFPSGELALLVYHMHAPVEDPMGNRSVEARQKYYEIRGAPTVLLDGRRFESGDDDIRDREDATAASQRVYDALRGAITTRLKLPAEAALRVEASREGSKVRATVHVEPRSDRAKQATLRVALVENEVHYSGENGLRFHLMVVRSVQTGDLKQTDYQFDVDDIAAKNLAYYPEYVAELKARVGPDFQVSFREEKHQIDAANLSVVAFLQDEQSKNVLQSGVIRIR